MSSNKENKLDDKENNGRKEDSYGCKGQLGKTKGLL